VLRRLGSGAAGSACGAASSLITFATLDLFFCPDPPLRRRVYPGLRQRLRPTGEAARARSHGGNKRNRGAGLKREQQSDGSVLFNISRNLGGSVGTSLLSTLTTQREQFHDVRIGERVTGYITYVQDFLNAQAAENLRRTGDPVAPSATRAACQ
jgi:hypothetical protein